MLRYERISKKFIYHKLYVNLKIKYDEKEKKKDLNIKPETINS